jgi:hypothetical protein
VYTRLKTHDRHERDYWSEELELSYLTAATTYSTASLRL